MELFDIKFMVWAVLSYFGVGLCITYALISDSLWNKSRHKIFNLIRLVFWFPLLVLTVVIELSKLIFKILKTIL